MMDGEPGSRGPHYDPNYLTTKVSVVDGVLMLNEESKMYRDYIVLDPDEASSEPLTNVEDFKRLYKTSRQLFIKAGSLFSGVREVLNAALENAKDRDRAHAINFVGVMPRPTITEPVLLPEYIRENGQVIREDEDSTEDGHLIELSNMTSLVVHTTRGTPGTRRRSR